MSQMKDQDKITARKLNETEINNMPDKECEVKKKKKECEVMVIKIITGLKKSGGPQRDP